MSPRTPATQGLHSAPGDGGAHRVFSKILNDFAAAQLLAAPKAPQCPSYGCDATLGPDSGIIDGTRYCADCVANEAEVAGREERKINTELFARFGGDA